MKEMKSATWVVDGAQGCEYRYSTVFEVGHSNDEGTVRLAKIC